MKILVSNDDGIDSPGIYSLVHELRKLGIVTVVAPDRQQSAVGHALSVSKPLRVTKFHRNGEMFGYSITGTPSDCVKLALSYLLDEKPDILVSGINHGQNTSINILYSGTVSAATEGMLMGIPSMAVSLASHSLSADCSYAAEVSRELAAKLPDLELPRGTLLNVNVPSMPGDQIKGIKVTPHSKAIWNDRYEKRTDPFGREYFWFAGEYLVEKDGSEFSDDIAILNGYVSITPIHYNFTNYEALPVIKELEKIKK